MAEYAAVYGADVRPAAEDTNTTLPHEMPEAMNERRVRVGVDVEHSMMGFEPHVQDRRGIRRCVHVIAHEQIQRHQVVALQP